MAQKLLDNYGYFFDDKYVYFQTKKGKLKGIMMRVPIWAREIDGLGSKAVEKFNRCHHEKQTRLKVRVKSVC